MVLVVSEPAVSRMALGHVYYVRGLWMAFNLARSVAMTLTLTDIMNINEPWVKRYIRLENDTTTNPQWNEASTLEKLHNKENIEINVMTRNTFKVNVFVICFVSGILQLATNSTYIRKQDSSYVYAYTSWNPVGNYLVWDAVKSQFDKVYET